MTQSNAVLAPMPIQFSQELAYEADSHVYFEAVRTSPWSMLLDSGQPHSLYGRYDIIVAAPFATVTTQIIDGQMVSFIHDHGSTTRSLEDPFQIVNGLIQHYTAQQSPLQQTASVPFAGGALGYFGYELGRCVETLPNLAKANNAIPAMMMGLYDWALIIDHQLKSARLVSYGLHPSTADFWPALCAKFQEARRNPPVPECVCEFRLSSAVVSNMTYAQYAHAFDQVKTYIKEGDCYQVNLAQRFSAEAVGDGWHAFKQLKAISPAPFMAFMNFDDLQVISGSPERFLQIHAGQVETRPIKGTRPRSDDPTIDAQQAQELQTSLKDRAENVMIVDLLRNDIGKNCAIGSVKADQLFQLQSFANVHHLVSIVTGTLNQGTSALDLLRGAFPGGSITGAPKLRAMQIIESLEPHQRAVYCGAIGYMDFNGDMDTNIAIRSAVYVKPTDNQTGEICFYAGGGIVADSVLEKEYNETYDKASSMLKTMQCFQSSSTEVF